MEDCEAYAVPAKYCKPTKVSAVRDFPEGLKRCNQHITPPTSKKIAEEFEEPDEELLDAESETMDAADDDEGEDELPRKRRRVAICDDDDEDPEEEEEDEDGVDNDDYPEEEDGDDDPEEGEEEEYKPRKVFSERDFPEGLKRCNQHITSPISEKITEEFEEPVEVLDDAESDTDELEEPVEVPDAEFEEPVEDFDDDHEEDFEVYDQIVQFIREGALDDDREDDGAFRGQRYIESKPGFLFLDSMYSTNMVESLSTEEDTDDDDYQLVDEDDESSENSDISTC